MLRQIGCFFETVLSSSTVLALADLVGLGIEVPQVLVPEHPAVIDGVAVGAVVVAIGRVLPLSVVTIVGLKVRISKSELTMGKLANGEHIQRGPLGVQHNFMEYQNAKRLKR